MIGFVFHPKSPRYVKPEYAAMLADCADSKTDIVALTVDAADQQLRQLHQILRPDIWQLHGKEPVERLQTIRQGFDRPVLKALGWAGEADLPVVLPYQRHADMLLLDAKPPENAAYPGGHGRPFDWSTLSALPPGLPFMLSGGLTPENVGEAIRSIRVMGLSLTGVDVSSGVESAPGVKDLGKIRAFVAAVREADLG